jgi:hypothetical protein
MAQPSVVTTRLTESGDDRLNHEAYASGVSWPAIIAGAFVTAALWLILLALGAGIGLSAVSPWARAGTSAATVGILGIFWLIIVQVIASAMGGYLAGRLRTKWATIHTDEVHFRDTAHGLLAWSVSLVITGAFLISAAGNLAGGMRPLGPAAALPASSDMAAEGQNLSPNAYFIDRLFRSDHPIADAKDAGLRAEAARIFTTLWAIKNYHQLIKLIWPRWWPRIQASAPLKVNGGWSKFMPKLSRLPTKPAGLRRI